MLGFYTIQWVTLERWHVLLFSILYAWYDVRGNLSPIRRHFQSMR